MVHSDMNNQTSKNQPIYDEGLKRILEVDLKDFREGRSGSSKCDTVQISKMRYVRMAELAIKQIELEAN